MPPATHGDGQVRPPCELHGRDDVGYTGAPCDERRVAVDRAVPDLAALVVGRIAGAHELPAESGSQCAQCGFVEPDFSRDGSHAAPPSVEATSLPRDRVVAVRRYFIAPI